MAERSVKCPVCPFQFASLVDAGNYHAYLCPGCKPALTEPADLPRLVPSWRFVVPETSEGVAADNLQQQLDELERPYERTLSDGDGDLG